MIIIAPVIYSAYELLLADKLNRIKECTNCGWLFLDTTKNGTRRWCSMNTCGSIVKAKEWYHRNKGK
jgi:predicted RNA-binding Zn ribbon-like protein